MSNIIELKQSSTKPNESVIGILEDLLADAKTGELQEIHCLQIMAGGNAKIAYSTTENLTNQIGHMEVLRASIMKRFFS